MLEQYTYWIYNKFSSIVENKLQLRPKIFPSQCFLQIQQSTGEHGL